MRRFFLNILFSMCFTCAAQDKIYLLNGEEFTGKVTEIGVDVIKYQASGEEHLLSRSGILMVEFRNGIVEVMNRPRENVVYPAEGLMDKRHEKNSRAVAHNNFISINNLSLFNSDLSLFYEKLFTKSGIGLGGMGAYNFNNYAGLMNTFIFVLPSAKKNYDLGVFANFYPNHENENAAFYLGILFKYTDLSFSKTIQSGTAPNITISYKPATGSQMSTIFTCGHQYNFSDSFFIKTIYGIGGFNLKGDYRDEYNYISNKDNKPGTTTRNSRFLLKLYFGLNAGIKF